MTVVPPVLEPDWDEGLGCYCKMAACKNIRRKLSYLCSSALIVTIVVGAFSISGSSAACTKPVARTRTTSNDT